LIPQAAKRFIETRRAYFRAVLSFAQRCQAQSLTELSDIEPLHVATYIEQLEIRLSKPSVKQHLAAIRILFDWLVIG
jgi:site-specific recombinase XerD